MARLRGLAEFEHWGDSTCPVTRMSHIATGRVNGSQGRCAGDDRDHMCSCFKLLPMHYLHMHYLHMHMMLVLSASVMLETNIEINTSSLYLQEAE